MDKKLRIGFVDYVLEPDKPGQTGLSDIVWDMASELVNQGHEAHVIASYYTDQYPDQRVIVHNFPTPPIGYRNFIGQLWILKRAADIAKKERFDIIQAPEYISSAVFATLGVKTPIVLRVPGNVYQRIEKGNPIEWWYSYVLRWAAKVSVRKCAQIIATSQEMKYWWELTGSSPDKTPLIPTGVNPNKFHRIENARAALGLPEDKIIFLYAGRFSIEKGLLDLLEAIHLLQTSPFVSQMKVYLIGGGALESKIKEKIKQLDLSNNIELINWVSKEELVLWYSAADAYILPSHTEGFSRTIPEAMICGLPVIGSRITGTEDHVINNETGFLFEPHNINQLYLIIQDIIHNKIILDELKQKTIQYALDNLVWSKIIRKYVQNVYIPILIEQHEQE